MFKWACLLVATAFLGFVAWVLNDVRLEVRRTSNNLNATSESINENLPPILEKTRKATDALGDDIPQIVTRTRDVSETVGELAADLRKMKTAMARLKTERDPDLTDYADSILDFVGQTDALVGAKPLVSLGSALQNPVPAKAWAASARNEAVLATIINKSKLGVLTSMTSNAVGQPWYVQFGNRRELMLDWLKAQHPETKALFAKEGT